MHDWYEFFMQSENAIMWDSIATLVRPVANAKMITGTRSPVRHDSSEIYFCFDRC